MGGLGVPQSPRKGAKGTRKVRWETGQRGPEGTKRTAPQNSHGLPPHIPPAALLGPFKLS